MIDESKKAKDTIAPAKADATKDWRKESLEK